MASHTYDYFGLAYRVVLLDNNPEFIIDQKLVSNHCPVGNRFAIPFLV